MKIVENIIALIIIPGCLTLILYICPTIIVDREWRYEHLEIEADMKASLNVYYLHSIYTYIYIMIIHYY